MHTANWRKKKTEQAQMGWEGYPMRIVQVTQV